MIRVAIVEDEQGILPTAFPLLPELIPYRNDKDIRRLLFCSPYP